MSRTLHTASNWVAACLPLPMMPTVRASSRAIYLVATPLAEIEQFNQTHGDIVQLGADAEAYGRAIMSVLGDDGRAQIDRRVAVARANGWGVRLEQMSNLIDGVLERLVSSESCVASQAS